MRPFLNSTNFALFIVFKYYKHKSITKVWRRRRKRGIDQKGNNRRIKQVEPIPWTHSALSGTKTVCSVAFSMSPRIFRVKVVRKVSMVGFLPLVYTEWKKSIKKIGTCWSNRNTRYFIFLFIFIFHWSLCNLRILESVTTARHMASSQHTCSLLMGWSLPLK